MVDINCPHCNGAIVLTAKVKTGFESNQTDKPFIESKASDSLRDTPKPEGMVNTEEAKNLKSKINVEGTVERKSSPRTVNLKSGGQIQTVDVYLCDQAGEIKLTLWGDEVGQVNNGNQVRITNGYTNTFKGDISLAKGKFGKLEILS